MAKKQETNGDDLDTLTEKYKDEIVGGRAIDEVKAAEIISTGSFWFDYVLGGGYRGGCWSRFYGPEECGKTSLGLSWAREWQKKYGEEARVVFLNGEGRLTQDLITRSGIIAEKPYWRIVPTNQYETAYGVVEDYIKECGDKYKFFVILDSTDAFSRAEDLTKDYTEAAKMASGATIASAAGRRLSLLFNCGGHHLFLCSQLRVTNMSPQAKGGKDASGGNAPKFYSSLIGEVKKPWSDTFLYEKHNDKKSSIIGRICEIKLHKTPNETSGKIVRIPIKYGMTGGVWTAYEAMMIAQAWKIYVPAKGSWWQIDPQWAGDLKSKNIPFEASLNGEGQLRDLFDNNSQLVEYCLKQGKIMAAKDSIKNKVAEDEDAEVSEEL